MVTVIPSQLGRLTAIKAIHFGGDDDDQLDAPPKTCGGGGRAWCISLAVLSAVGLIVLIFACAERLPRAVMFAHAFASICGITSFALLSVFFDSYPSGFRCKNDEAFVAAWTILGVGGLAFLFACAYSTKGIVVVCAGDGNGVAEPTISLEIEDDATIEMGEQGFDSSDVFNDIRKYVDAIEHAPGYG